MIRGLAFAFFLVVALGSLAAPARADCTLTSNGQTRPPGTIVLETVNNIALYCDGTVWKPLAFAAGAGGANCFSGWILGDTVAEDWNSVAASEDGMKAIATVWQGGLYTSDDGGATWIARGGAPLSSLNWVDVASSADGTKLAAVAAPSQIYISADSGITWTARATSRNWSGIATSSDGTKLAATVDNGQIYTSVDSGVTWTPRATTRHWSSVASSSDGTKLVAAVNPGGQIYTSSDSGVTWVPRASAQDWNDVASSADGTQLIGAAFQDSLYLSTDSGATWAVTGPSGGLNWSRVASSADGAKIVAAAAYGQRAYTTEDGGASWMPQLAGRDFWGAGISSDGSRVFLADATTDSRVLAYSAGCPGGGALNCTDDDTATCTLDAGRDSGDPEFTAANIVCGVNILGVTGTAGGDSTPDAFGFSDNAGAPLSTLTASSIAQITGITCPSTISIAGGGSPEYRTCTNGTSPANCDASVVQDWTSGPGTIQNNQYLQLRLITSASYGTMLSATVTIGTGSDQWDVSTPCGVSSTGLAGYWKLNEGSGSTTAADSNGMSNTGTLTNMTPASDWVTGKVGGALDLDNTDDYVLVSDSASLDITGELSISAWIRPNSVSGSHDIIGKGDAVADTFAYLLVMSDDELEFWTCQGTNGACTTDAGRETTNSNLSAGAWHHVALAYNDAANTVIFYVDGSARSDIKIAGADNDPETQSLRTGSMPLRIGRIASSFNGIVDDVRIYGRALSVGEIGQLYNTGAGCSD